MWTVANGALETNSTANPAVGDLNGDGSPEIVVQAENNRQLAFSAQGATLWKSDLVAGGDGRRGRSPPPWSSRARAHVPVRVHDFVDPDLGKAIPYGVYDPPPTTVG